MTNEQATALVKLLADAFSKKLEPGTVTVYTQAFERLKSSRIAYETVKEIIDNSERFPTVAVIRAAYMRKRNTELEGEESKQIQAALQDEIVREVPPAALQLLAEMRTRSKDFDITGLPEVEGGKCNDCGKNSDIRYAYGSFALCGADVAKRMRAKEEA